MAGALVQRAGLGRQPRRPKRVRAGDPVSTCRRKRRPRGSRVLTGRTPTSTSWSSGRIQPHCFPQLTNGNWLRFPFQAADQRPSRRAAPPQDLGLYFSIGEEGEMRCWLPVRRAGSRYVDRYQRNASCASSAKSTKPRTYASSSGSTDRLSTWLHRHLPRRSRRVRPLWGDPHLRLDRSL